VSNTHLKVLAANIASSGVKYAFGITGGGASIKLIKYLQQEGVVYYPVGHEGAGAFMAGACCRDGHVVAVSIAIKGPGFVNLIPGILSNSYEGRPAITLSEYYSGDIPLYRMHKRIDHSSLTRTLTKIYTEINGREDQIKQLISICEEEPIGPAHIDFGPAPSEKAKFKVHKEIDHKTVDQARINHAIEYIEKSKKPVLVLGSWACRLCNINFDKLEVPVVTTAAGKGCFNEFSDYSGGVMTGEITLLSPETQIIKNSDLIITIGLRNHEVIKADLQTTTLIMIDNVDFGMQDGFLATLSLVGNNVELSIPLIINKLEEKCWGKEMISRYKSEVSSALALTDWLPAKVFQLLQKHLSQDAILVLDTGFFCTVGETVWKARSSNNFCSSSVGRFMGSAIPTSIGVSISSKDNPVLCVMGDGGISPYVGEILLAVKEQLQILFVFMTDGLYGSISAFSSNDMETMRAVDIGVDSWCDTVRGMGCKSLQVNNEAELINTLQDWKKYPLFLELPFEPKSYAEIAIKLR
jgi:acetolactate synthase I/II/III large subunit